VRLAGLIGGVRFVDMQRSRSSRQVNHMEFRTSVDPSRRPGLGLAASFSLLESLPDMPRPRADNPETPSGRGSGVFKRRSAPVGAGPWPFLRAEPQSLSKLCATALRAKPECSLISGTSGSRLPVDQGLPPMAGGPSAGRPPRSERRLAFRGQSPNFFFSISWPLTGKAEAFPQVRAAVAASPTKLLTPPTLFPLDNSPCTAHTPTIGE